MESKPPVGSRVRYMDWYVRSHPGVKQKAGTVHKYTPVQNVQAVKVLWDGNSKMSILHPKFLELIPDD